MTKLDFTLMFLFLTATVLGILFMVSLFKNRPKRKTVFLAIISFFVFSFLILYPHRGRVIRRINQVSQYSPIRIFDKNHCRCERLELPKDDYRTLHRPTAIRVTNNGYLRTAGILNNFLLKKRLVSVVEGEGFWIPPLTHSSKHLTPTANERLLELGKRFRTSLKNTPNEKDYFVVSSITRTQFQQDDLVKLDPGATKGKSTHSFGVSFDISEIKSTASCEGAYDALNNILLHMRDEGKLLLCPENDCIHVTVIK